MANRLDKCEEIRRAERKRLADMAAYRVGREEPEEVKEVTTWWQRMLKRFF